MTTTPKDPQPMNEQLAKETCMCGDPIQDHGTGDGGHAPVSQYDHYKAQTTPEEGETTSLLPCPFCDDEATVSEGYRVDGSPWIYIECLGCSAIAEPEMWNRRTLSPARHPKELGGPDSPRYKITCRQRSDGINTYEIVDKRTGAVKMRSRNFARVWAQYRSVK